MAERGTLTKIVFGGVTANVALLKASGKPTEAKHETRRVEVESGAVVEPRARMGVIELGGGGIGVTFDSAEHEVERMRRGAPADDPMGGAPSSLPVAPPPVDDFDTPNPAEPWNGTNPESRDAITGEAIPPGVPRRTLGVTNQEYVPPLAPTSTVQQGVWVGEGDERAWVDLTDELASIDRCSKLEGLTVVKCVPASAVPRMQVRDSSWIAPNAEGAGKVLRLIWHGLHDSRRAAVVVYSKRTNQALGMVQAVGTRNRPALALIELEWAQNMRDAPSRARDPIAAAEVSEREVAAARSLVEALSAPASVIDTLRDERLTKRAELLDLAREGKLGDYEPPPEPPAEAEGDDLAAAMLAAAGR